MVYFIKHRYKEADFYFIWDVESGSLHNVDYAAFLCGKKRYNNDLTALEESEYNNLSIVTQKEILASFDALEQEGSLNASPILTKFKKNPLIVKALCLNICHDCNMRCEYCFAKGGCYDTPRDYMSLEVAKNAVDFLIANSGSRKSLEIDFFGGEPLMNLQVIKDTVIYAKEQAKISGKEFSFTTTTNCVLLDDETIEYLNKEMFNIVLSIDGRKETHNRVRHCVNKDITYEQLLENAKKVKTARKDRSYYVRGTFTALNKDFANDIFALNDAGFDQISIEPVVLDQNSPLSIKEEHIYGIKKEYERFANEYLDRRTTTQWFNFFHFMVDLECGACINKRLTGCGAGTEYLSVSPTGDIYPCHQFVGMEKFVIGNVFEGIKNKKIREDFSEISIMSKPKCLECFAKYYCGGGCAANAYNYGGGIETAYELGCELTRKRFELSLAVAGIENIMNKDN